MSPGESDKFNYAYYKIDINLNDEELYKDIEKKSKDLINKTDVFKEFIDNEYYKILIGNEEFTKCLYTSEYLYKQYNASDCFDYTAIISGYLKSIEQLLYAIVKINFKSNNIIDIDLDIESNKDKLTMGKLLKIINDNKKIFRINQYTNVLKSCIYCYKDECRNGSFHKSNIESWKRVEIIRKNTFFLYVLILGGFNIGENKEEAHNNLKVIDDKLERIYCQIKSITSNKIYVRFNGEEPIRVKPKLENNYPLVGNDGCLKNYAILLESVEKKDFVTDNPTIVIIKRDRIPNELWYEDENGKKIYMKI